MSSKKNETIYLSVSLINTLQWLECVHDLVLSHLSVGPASDWRIFVMHYNQQSIDLFLTWYDSQPVCTVFTVSLSNLQLLATYKKVLS